MLALSSMKNILVLLFVFLFSFLAQAQCLEQIKSYQANYQATDFKSQSNTKAIENLFVTCLGEYIRIKTVAPNAQEEKAVLFFQNIFTALDIPYLVYEVDSLIKDQVGQKKSNIIATLSQAGSKPYDWSRLSTRPSIILTHHMDVVDVVKSQWQSPELTFSGALFPDVSGEQFIWGRGALDMKGVGISQLLTFLWLKINNITLSHDIHFLALADEEEAGSGAIGTMKLMLPGQKLHGLSRTRVILNEGGGGVKNIPIEGVNLNLIDAEQKGAAWLSIEHKNLILLISKLDKLRPYKIAYKQEKKFRVKPKGSCQVLSIQGPEPKANVIVSNLKLKLDCPDISLAMMSKTLNANRQDNYFKIDLKDGFYEIEINSQSSSHGSVGLSISAIDILISSLYRLRIYEPALIKPKPRFYKRKRTDATQELISVLKKYDKQLRFVSKLQFIPMIRNLILKEIENSFDVDGLFSTSCQLTNLNYNNQKMAQAIIDCRLLHTAFELGLEVDHAKHFIKTLSQKKYLGESFNYELISGWNYSTSSFQTPEFNAIKKALMATDANAIVAPFLNPAGSDNAWFRNPQGVGISGLAPLKAFGVFPGNFTPDLVATMHGSDERFPLKEAVPAVERFIKIVLELDKLP
jgi:acetylornithine deacetylase/succinyl-diaminopimelate desuccinylase-like protein